MRLWPGRLDASVLRTLYGHELRMLARDRRTILIAVVAPIVIFPLLIGVTRYVEDRQARDLEATTFRYALTGTEAELARSLVEEAVTMPADTGEAARVRPAMFEEVPTDSPDSLLANEEIHFIVEGVSAAEWRSIVEADEAERRSAAPADDDSVRMAGMGEESRDPLIERAEVPVLRIHSQGSIIRSVTGSQRIEERLQVVRERRQEQTLRALGFPLAPDALVPVEVTNVATAQREGGALLGRFLTVILVMLMLTGGSIIAVDTIAGEKERGTLENLLTTAARRSEIVASKQLAVISVGIAISLISVLNLLVYLTIGLVEVPDALAAVSVGPAALVVLLLLFLPLAVLVSSALLLLSGYSKGYKEYQIYFFPVFLLFLLPPLAAILPGMELRSLIAIVPLANVSVAVREVLVGEFDWPFLAIAFLSTTAAAVYGARLTATTLSTERLITASDLDRADLEGGPAIFPRRVLRWFATMWALLLLVSVWIPPDLDIRGHVVINILGIFLGGTILMIRRYRLPVREALSLRLPHPIVWPMVLLGTPAALLTGIGIAELLDFVVPVPQEVLESFGQFLVTEELAVWQVIFFLAVVPGVCEELAFRGVLLYGIRPRLSPVRAAIAVGLIFGFFHVSIFRIGPTAYLGLVLAAVVILTGSIYPAIFWHALNNAIALLLPRFGVWENDTPPMWMMPVAAATLAAVFFVLWKVRGKSGNFEL